MKAAPVQGKQFALFTLTALGVVYGDIGTSPLYAVRECFHGPYAIEASEANVLGVLSLIVWSLVLVISIKYLVIILRADNDGEGGILALMAKLLSDPTGRQRRSRVVVVMFGILGAALLYGDGMITPAISVLSAVEGLEVATPLFAPYVIPLTIGILLGLFVLQYRGTAGIGVLFGPVMLVWFSTLAVLGLAQISRHPQVLWAINPAHGFDFLFRNGFAGFMILGLVFLVVTGGEALYADMGHFGPRPIRTGWFGLVFFALLLNYAGQGALLLSQPEAAVNPFYRMAPAWALYPLVILATAATVIASQAVISGAFSLTLQGVHLGYLPRLRITHTSAAMHGQIYVPLVNWALMLAAIGLVVGFRSSSALAGAYGVAVTTTMVITDILIFLVMYRVWKWPLSVSLAVTLFFFFIDLAFFGANIIKVAAGGWFPLAVAVGIYLVMATWREGRRLLASRLKEKTSSVDQFLEEVAGTKPARVEGDAIFMTRDADVVPAALIHSYRHYHVLHERIVFLTLATRSDSAYLSKYRLQFHDLGQGFYRASAYYGFMEDPDIMQLLPLFRDIMGLELELSRTTFFLGKETLFATKRPGMAIWREKLFAFMSRNAQRATDYFNIPPERVMEVGTQVEL